MSYGQLDRRIQFRRAVRGDDGYSTVEDWADHGAPVWASRRDVSDGEKVAAGATFAEITARFQVRSSAFTRSITPKDALTEGGREFQIIGIKEIGRRDRLEITAIARMDNEDEG